MGGSLLELPKDGRERVVRHGHGPERQVQTGIGPVAVQRAKLRDRGAGGDGKRIRFTSAILPRWSRRTRSLDALLPILYLRGVSMGDFQEALGALLGKDAPNLSPSVIARLRGEWEADYARWQRRDLSARRYVYVWADGVLLAGAHGAAGRVHAGADRRDAGRQGGTARLPGGRSWSRFRQRSCWNTSGGMRESAQSWRELLVDLKARGLTIAPELATGDGASASGRRWTRCRRRPGTSAVRCTPSVRNRVVLDGAGPLLPGGGERSGMTWRISRRPSPTMMRSITSCKMPCFSVRVASAKRLRTRSQNAATSVRTASAWSRCWRRRVWSSCCCSNPLRSCARCWRRSDSSDRLTAPAW